MPYEMSFAGEIPGGAEGLRLYFVPSRTSVVSCKVQGLEQGATSVSMQIHTHGVDVQWEPMVPGSTRIVLSLALEGEPFVVAQAIWRGGDWNAVLPNALGTRHLEILAAAEEPLLDFEVFARKVCTERDELVRTHPDPKIRKYATFFWDLDRQTNKALIPCARLCDGGRRVFVIDPMEILLAERLIARKQFATANPNVPAEGLPKSPKEDVDFISKILLKVYREHLSGGGRRLEMDEVWTAFEMFANGELQVPNARGETWNGEPNGAHLFSFAEFALMAIECEVDADEWFRILPSHVAIQEIFSQAYHPPAGTLLRFESYITDNWSEDKKVDDKKKKGLRDCYSGMSLHQMKIAAGLNLAAALADHT